MLVFFIVCFHFYFLLIFLICPFLSFKQFVYIFYSYLPFIVKIIFLFFYSLLILNGFKFLFLFLWFITARISGAYFVYFSSCLCDISSCHEHLITTSILINYKDEEDIDYWTEHLTTICWLEFTRRIIVSGAEHQPSQTSGQRGR